MSTFNRVKRYRTPLIEIDQKIKDLDEAMTTTGYYTQVAQNSGQEYIPPTMGDAPQGSVGANDFTWPDQGDGSVAGTINVPSFSVTDALNRNIARYGYIPGVIYHDGDERRDPDYSNFDGKMPLAMVIDGRALASTRIFYLTNEGLHLVMQIGAYTTPGPYSDLQKAVSEWWQTGRGTQNLTQKTIYIWGGLQFLVGGYYGASQYYPADRSTTTDPVADRGLYAYSMYVPGAPDNPNFATDAGQRSLPPRVTQILNRNDLGDPNYYPGPIAMDLPTLQEMIQEYNNPYTPSPAKQNILRGLDNWAKPGSRNRRTLQGLGIPLV